MPKNTGRLMVICLLLLALLEVVIQITGGQTLVPAIVYLVGLCMVAKLVGDLAWRFFSGHQAEWAYLSDYLANEWLTYSIYALSLAAIQSAILLYLVPGTLGYRLGQTALPAVIIFFVVRYAQEIKLTRVHQIGRRVRLKYGLE
ncbi:MAG: hypothetical protein AB1331_03035 [Bacillota bacterium]